MRRPFSNKYFFLDSFFRFALSFVDILFLTCLPTNFVCLFGGIDSRWGCGCLYAVVRCLRFVCFRCCRLILECVCVCVCVTVLFHFISLSRTPNVPMFVCHFFSFHYLSISIHGQNSFIISLFVFFTSFLFW